jgi:nucleotide-binding universal stress UspA family protein
VVNVLLATDGSDPALRACQAVASLLTPDRDQVRILTVLSYSLYPYSGIPDEPLADEAERERHVEAEVRRITDEPLRILEDAGLGTEVVHRFGNVTEQIVAEINEWRPDLIALGRRGVHGVERLIGSVSEHVLHNSKVPTLLVP